MYPYKFICIVVGGGGYVTRKLRQCPQLFFFFKACLFRVIKEIFRGLLDRSTALYFYKQLKTSLHKPRGNLLEKLFSKKCAFKNNLQLLEKSFGLEQIQHL
jgi:hypothetical protein